MSMTILHIKCLGKTYKIEKGIIKKSIEYAKKVEKIKEVVGQKLNKKALAGAVVYAIMVTDNCETDNWKTEMTQQQIANALEINIVSLRDIYRRIVVYRKPKLKYQKEKKNV